MISMKEYLDIGNCKILTIDEENKRKEYEDWLFNEYPFLKFDEYNLLEDIPYGWAVSFGEDLLRDLKEALVKNNLLDSYVVFQIKEKFGGLRWYDNTGNDDVCKVLNKYESLSYKTCIDCGKPAKYISRGWICPYCEDCITGDADQI